MADTFTLNYNFTKPEPAQPGWDGKINVTFDNIDTEIKNRENEIVALDSALQDLSGVSNPVVARQNLGVVGKQTIWVPSQAMLPTVSNGCSALGQAELTAGQPDLVALDFAPGVDEYAQRNGPH